MFFIINLKFLSVFFCFSGFIGGVWAQQARLWHLESAPSTQWVEFSQGLELSKLGATYRAGGYESSAGQWIGFDRWYRPRWTDTRMVWMTPLSPELGLLWGGSTGEQAKKYKISPSLKLGFVYRTSLGGNAFFSINASSVIGGRMTESPCLASYGEFQVIAQVNCRLAATEMAPAETLKHLTRALPPDRHQAQVRYTRGF